MESRYTKKGWEKYTKEVDTFYKEMKKPKNILKSEKAWKELPSKEKKAFKNRFYREHWKGGELG